MTKVGPWMQSAALSHPDTNAMLDAARVGLGTRFLDAGCSFGFLPLLISERFPFLTAVVGIDIEIDSFPTVRAIADEQQLKQVQFAQVDLLADDASSIGMFDTVTALLGQVESGQVRALGVTGKDRFPAVPNVPAAIESGVAPGYDVTTWYGLFGPKGLDPEIAEILEARANPGEVADSVAVLVGEAPDVHLVDDGLPPPAACNRLRPGRAAPGHRVR